MIDEEELLTADQLLQLDVMEGPSAFDEGSGDPEIPCICVKTSITYLAPEE